MARMSREQAESDYVNKVVPILRVPFHIMGSRILSRGFRVQVEAQLVGDDDIESCQPALPEVVKTDFDESMSLAPTDNAESGSEGLDDGSDEDDPGNVTMVPMADMLNARCGCENAKLFYEQHDLRMVTTRSIRQGEQIWNTYGDPPNSDLLRRYGHVDQVPLANGNLGNPADIVEIRADVVVASVEQRYPQLAGPWSSGRVNWWLEEGGDDVFEVNTSSELPEEMISFTRLLIMSSVDWEKSKRKSKLPKPKVDETVLSLATDVVRRRLAEYPTTIEEDEELLKDKSISLNLKHAIVVRLGEKRILHGLLRVVTEGLEASCAAPQLNGENRKRKRDETGAGRRRSAK
ncbi:Rubisco LSMT, substrate-binding domain-containing protein [Multifurca ochricompacta]|uniref:Rubisco LSMT, substrate-binding domain-containing protein n=1 Tax=Multifurca ochricompacta TaxID=376703 RepID=A0AAD4M7Q9_9AGAM|nr:Rubisco LSMT, substrate-binding domain-containing protein [Multifurca ochricompacta]